MSFSLERDTQLSTLSPGGSEGAGVALSTFWECYPVLIVGTVPTDATLDAHIEESDDGVDWIKIAGSAFPTVYDTGSGSIHYGLLLNNSARKGLVRFNLTAAGGDVPVVAFFLMDRRGDPGQMFEWRVDA